VEKYVQTTWCELKYLLVGPECYKDTQIKAYDITKLTAELKSDNVKCRNKHKLLLDVLVLVGVAIKSTASKSNLPYQDSWA